MISLFRSANPVLMAVNVLIAVVLFFKLYTHPPEIIEYSSAPIYQFVYQSLFEWIQLPQWIYTSVLILYFIWCGMVFNETLYRFRFVNTYNFVGALVFISVLAVWSPYLYFTPACLSILPLLYLIRVVLTTAVKDDLMIESFDIGLLIALLSMIYTPFKISSILIFSVMAYLSPFYWRYWLIILVGILAPYIIYISYLFFFELPSDFLFLLNDNPGNIVEFNMAFWIKTGSLLLILPLLIYLNDNRKFKLTVLHRKFRILLGLLSIGLLAFSLLHNNLNYEALILCTVVASFFYSVFFFQSRQMPVANLLHFILIAVILVFQHII